MRFLGLSNRKQYLMFNNKNSEFTEIRTGVPQGSILVPCYLVFI